MCGRYTLRETVTEVAKCLKADDKTGLPAKEQRERYDVAPSRDVPILVTPDDDREIRLVQWGLIPRWVTDRAKHKPLNNARADSVADKPSFRKPFASKRCLIPAYL